MRCVFLRGLVLVLSLLPALPPGWCCGVAGLCAPAAETAPPCPSCCGHAARDGIPDAPSGVPCSRTPLDNQQPCCRAVDAAPVKAGDIALDVGLSAEVIPIASVSAQACFRLADTPSPPPVPLQLLHCVWTC